MSNDNNTIFKALDDAEKKSKLFQLANGKSSNIVTVWKKGSSEKYELKATDYIRAKSEIYFNGKFDESLTGESLLMTFELSGLHFFGKCRLQSKANLSPCLVCDDDIYKSERRNNFRLLTYPHHQVFLNINVGKEEIERSNVLSLNTGKSETGIFKNFLEILDEDKDEKPEDFEGYLRFRVIDISVTGLAFQFGKIEKQFFKELNKSLGNVYLDFNGDMIRIPDAKILYIVDKPVSNSSAILYKAGVQFLEVDTNLDAVLAKRINETLRSTEAEFEDFIK